MRLIGICRSFALALAAALALFVLSGTAAAVEKPRHKPTKLWSAYPLGQPHATPDTTTAEPLTPPRRDLTPGSTEAVQSPVAGGDDGSSTTLLLVVVGLVGATLMSVAVVGRRARAPAATVQLAGIPREGAGSMARFNRKQGEKAAAESKDERNVVRLADKMSSYTVEEGPDEASQAEEEGDSAADTPAARAAESDEKRDTAKTETPSTPAPASYAELGAHVSAMLAVTDETARKIVADARAEADALKAEADAYAEKRRRDAHENAARITAKAADDARSLEQAGEETRSQIEEESERHRQLVLMSQMIEESLRQTIASGRETLDQLDTMVDELSREAEGWEDRKQVQQASA